MPEMVRVGPAWVQLELIEGEEGHCGLLAVSAVSAEEGLLQLYVQLPEGLLSIYSGFVTRHGGAQDTSLAKAWRGTRYAMDCAVTAAMDLADTAAAFLAEAEQNYRG